MWDAKACSSTSPLSVNGVTSAGIDPLNMQNSWRAASMLRPHSVNKVAHNRAVGMPRQADAVGNYPDAATPKWRIFMVLITLR
jgi:hypothetical protein